MPLRCAGNKRDHQTACVLIISCIEFLCILRIVNVCTRKCKINCSEMVTLLERFLYLHNGCCVVCDGGRNNDNNYAPKLKTVLNWKCVLNSSKC